MEGQVVYCSSSGELQYPQIKSTAERNIFKCLLVVGGGSVVGRGLHVNMLGAGFHIRLVMHVVIAGPVGSNPDLHWSVAVEPTTRLVAGPRTPFETVGKGEQPSTV